MCEARLTHSEVEAEHLLHIVSVVVQQLLQTPGQGGGERAATWSQAERLAFVSGHFVTQPIFDI